MTKKEDILKKIKKGEVKMKPRWKFTAEERAKDAVWLITLVIAAFGMLMVKAFGEFYEVEEMWQLGEVGRSLLLEDLPYLWIFISILMFILAFAVERKIGENYKKSKVVLWMVEILMIFVIAAMINFLGLEIGY